MTDKVQKIREYLVGMASASCCDAKTKKNIETNILPFIDSMQEEPVSDIDFEQELYKTFGQVKDFTLGMQIAKRFYEMGKQKQEPVSEESKEIAWNYADKRCHLDAAVFTPDEVKKEREKMQFTWQDLYDAVMSGAKWQEKQDQSTIELAEDHAMLAGMKKMKEEMMAKAIYAVVSQVPCSNEIILYNPSSVDRYYLPQEMNKLGLNKGDKVKLVIIKDD